MRASISLIPTRRSRFLSFALVTTVILTLTWVSTRRDVVHEITDFDLSLAPNRLVSTDANTLTSTGIDTAEKTPREFCQRHGWEEFKPATNSASRRKVYDLFMVNTELDWLEIRLNSTYDHVDYFVAVEAPKTFTGHDKPLFLKQNWDRFAPYHDKIIYHEVQYPDGFDPATAWGMEDFIRDAMYSQVLPRLEGEQAPTEGDAIIVADVDEIPRPHALEVLRTCRFPRRLTLGSRFYYYSFQFLHRGPEWPHPQATYYEGASRTLLPSNLRNGDGGFRPLRFLERGNLGNAAWHCSSCFETIEEMLTKMSSFSHVGLNHEFFRNKDRIAQHVRHGKDLWDREGEEYDRLENNMDVPAFVLGDEERFRYLLNRDGESAGFIDYPG